MSTTDLIWWVAIIGIQACLAISNRHSMGFLRAFLAAETFVGSVLLAIARIAGPWTYFYSWIAGTIIHHGLCAFLMWSLFDFVRLRGLPNRQNRWPVVLLGLASLMLGLYYASRSYGIIQHSAFRMVRPMDHALSFAIGCMIAGLPFYAIYVSASIPKHVNLVIAGLAIYEFSYAGLLGSAISAHPKVLSHAVDCVYLVSLFLWSQSLRSKRPSVAAERLPSAPNLEENLGSQ
jgi:hypothetical protein